MLHLMLGDHHSAVAVGEVSSWFRPTKQHHFQLGCACGDLDCPRWAQLREERESRFHRAVAEETGARYVVDSSKEISWLIDTRRWAAKSGMEVRNVFVWKDPVELAFSFWKRRGDLWLWRREFVKYYQRLEQLKLPIATVNLGEALRSPESKIADLAKAVGMNYEKGMERFWEFEHHHLFGSYGVKRQTQIGDSFFKPPSYPAEFEVHLDELKSGIEEDTEVARLIELLRANDVSEGQAPMREVALSHPLPVWYYAQKAKHRVRRYRPRHKDPDRSHSVATIPVDERAD